MALSKEEAQFFQNCASELLKCGDVQLMSNFIQHANVSTLEHSVSVAYYSYLACRKLNLDVDYRNMIRGALLHDFFLYDWHLKSDRKGLHGFTHPKTALENAEEHFSLNDMERDIIIKHMWPLTLTPPKYREALIVSLSDKFCSLIETLRIYPGIISRSAVNYR
ncbi:MAG TPA: HD domain-containing protein [Caproiciproducens sp.]|jgi:Predicted HD superfamily hydrolase|nr:HD domain-containing protein [Caproiciproducens sp.]